MSTGRSTTTRDRHRRAIARDKPDCTYCNQPINYDTHHLDPLSFTIDHVTPLSRGGTDTLDNCVPAHRACNRQKSNKLNYQPGVTFVTDATTTSGIDELSAEQIIQRTERVLEAREFARIATTDEIAAR